MTTLYTIDGCIKCFQAKRYLQEQGIPFQEINILKVPEAIPELKETAGEVVTPVLHDEATVLIGLNILNYKQSIH
ncbi:glutaredoxin [Pontibacillus halophilus JSM 076056 = DSM 19796]|uniref:Glutaredoxin n=1 Tax=Pontibacillus halophilus JSM 076056 = DSM 19796 TaxID=1385510 RepID=A0A0A5I3Z9_9BACI|nr:glutaredoxin family protein [Pontibacillus halophilus]KGX90532.1 glutaredoxin [Pontibacillus halophilus JSM 076056 = DSM 19796]